MTITRLAPARGSKHVARMATAAAALATVMALTVAGVAERTALAASFTVLGHLHWLWIPAALLLESASIGWSCSGCAVPRPGAVPVHRAAPPTNRTPPWPLI